MMGPSRRAFVAIVLLLIVSMAAAEDKSKRKIPLVGGLIDKLLKGKKSADAATDTAAPDSPEVADPVAADVTTNVEVPEQKEQVCKSDATGKMNCVDKDELVVGEDIPYEEMEVTGDGEQQSEMERLKENIFQCKDMEEKCADWAKMDDGHACETHSAYMTQYCPISCGTCDISYLGHRLSTMLEGGLAVIPFCQDNDFNCKGYAHDGECDKNPEYMNMFCEASCGICSEESNRFGVGQKLHKELDKYKSDLVKETLDTSIAYMKKVKRDRLYKDVRDHCLNKVPDCTLWASQGECENNADYMKAMCAPACNTCDYIGDVSETCEGLPESSGPLWKPGDLNKFFENVADDADGTGEYAKYNPKALSRPKTRSNGRYEVDDIPDGPWVVLLENFLSDEEADRLVEIGHRQGYQSSTRALGPGQVEKTDGRTSANTWCKQGGCMEDPLVAPVLERIAAVTKSTVNHSEHLQLLKYTPGQFYVPHHDFIPYQLDQPCGARIMTLFLYLNDVEEGGNTSFPELGISVKPKKGSALLWPSVKDEDPMESDLRMEHEANVVVKGVKYGANAWIHSEDFQTPLALGCT